MAGSLQLSIVNLAHEQAFALGRLDVRPATREVVGPAFREVLEPRVMQVLVALSRHAGAVVSRDDLTQACWEGRVVGEDAINRVISRLRRLAERDEGRSFTLETITKVGYRLVEATPEAAGPQPEASGSGPTEQADAEAVSAAAVQAVPPAVTTRFARRWIVIAAVALLAVLATGALYFWRPWETQTERTARAQADYVQAEMALDSASAEDTARAVSLLQKVVEDEPGWADAWAQLAIAYLATLEFNTPEAQRGISARARAAASRALEIEPGHPAAEYVLVVLDPTIRPWREVEQAQLALLERSPASRPFIALRMGFLGATGQLKGAFDIAEARGMKPEGPRALGTYAAVLANAGRLEEAERVLDEATERYPRNRSVYFQRFWISVFTGQAERALALIEDLSSRPTGTEPQDFAVYRATAQAFVSRDKADIEDAIRRNQAIAKRGRGYAQNAMRTAASLGYLDMAFELAEALFFDRGGAIGPLMFSEAQGQYASRNSRPVYLLYDIGTRTLRHDMRFVGLAEGLGLGDYWRESGHWPDFCADDPEAAKVCEALRNGK